MEPLTCFSDDESDDDVESQDDTDSIDEENDEDSDTSNSSDGEDSDDELPDLDLQSADDFETALFEKLSKYWYRSLL